MRKSGYIHNFIEKDKDSPTLLLLHGTGGDENDLIPLGDMIAPEFNILSLRGKVVENGMNRFFRRFGEGVFDYEDIKFRAEEIAGFIESASEKYGFDKNKIIAIGFSNGANMAASILLLEPSALKGAVLLRPMLPIKPESNVNLKDKIILMLSGKDDDLMPKESVTELYEVLQESNAKVEMKWLDAGHDLVKEDINISREWFKNFN